MTQNPATSDVRIWTSTGEALIFHGTDDYTVLTPNTNGFRVSDRNNSRNYMIVAPTYTWMDNGDFTINGGGVKIGASNTTCGGAQPGLLKYVGGKMYLCDGVSWKALKVE